MFTEKSHDGSVSRLSSAEAAPITEIYDGVVLMAQGRHLAYTSNLIFNHRVAMPTVAELSVLGSENDRIDEYSTRDAQAAAKDRDYLAMVNEQLGEAADSATRLAILLENERVKSIDLMGGVQRFVDAKSLSRIRLSILQALHDSQSRVRFSAPDSSLATQLNICVDDSVAPEGEVIVTASRLIAVAKQCQLLDLDENNVPQIYDMAVAERITYALDIADVDDPHVAVNLHASDRVGFVNDEAALRSVNGYVGMQDYRLRPICGDFYAYRHPAKPQESSV